MRTGTAPYLPSGLESASDRSSRERQDVCQNLQLIIGFLLTFFDG